jgi:hypothetical protein
MTNIIYVYGVHVWDRGQTRASAIMTTKLSEAQQHGLEVSSAHIGTRAWVLRWTLNKAKSLEVLFEYVGGELRYDYTHAVFTEDALKASST